MIELNPNNSRVNQTRIVFTPSNHWSTRKMFDRIGHYRELWGSWAVIGKNGNKFWFGGDTAYSEVFKQIGQRLGPFQLAAIPIGSYKPRELLKMFHVNPNEAVKIHYDIHSQKSLGMHWGTFKLGWEFYLEPRTWIQDLVLKYGKLVDNKTDALPFYTVSIGETLHGDV